MKKLWDVIARDLWIVLLDILAVNAAYFLALQVRFVGNITEETIFTNYMPYWLKFVPFYTVACLVVFFLFRLYGGMWRFAGVNDMNRIIGASAATALIQVLGTLLFIRRMPIKYYIIGAILQFLLISLIRFSYRILLVEKQKVTAKKTAAVPALIIGAGEIGRKAVIHLEEGSAFRPVMIVDKKNAGKSLNGIPVVEDLEQALRNVKAVFIADPTLDPGERKLIREKAETLGIELQDYTGYLSNLGGTVPLSSLLELSAGPVTIAMDGRETEYESGEAALQAISGRYEVAAVRNLKIDLKKASGAPYAGYEDWVRQHKEQTGEDVSFF